MATDKTSPAPPHNRRLIYGRRQGHRLHAAQARRIAEILPEFEPELTAGNLAQWFGARVPETGFDTFALEIGFGGGEHLAACAKAAPRTGFIGCEPFINGVAKLLDKLKPGVWKICVYIMAMPVMSWQLCPPVCWTKHFFISRPVAKKRHHKRRFVNQENLDSLFRVLPPMPDCLWQPISLPMRIGHWPR